MTQAQITQLAHDIAKGLKPIVQEMLSGPVNEMNKVVTRRELWAFFGRAPNQSNGGKPAVL